MAANEEKKMMVGSTLKAKKWSLKVGPKTNSLPLSVRSETHLNAKPMASNAM